MSQVIITFDIIEYFPSDFNYDEYSFIIISENKEFEQEISYLNQNQISHKAFFTKKDLKYSIKVIKSGALIGISDIIIPAQILSKKENIFDKTCQITMTDSVKKIIFGSTSSALNLKFNLHLTLQYIKTKKSPRKRNIKKEEKAKKNFSSDNYNFEENAEKEESTHSYNIGKNKKRLNSTYKSNVNLKKSSNMKLYQPKSMKSKAYTSNKLKHTKNPDLDIDKTENDYDNNNDIKNDKNNANVIDNNNNRKKQKNKNAKKNINLNKNDVNDINEEPIDLIEIKQDQNYFNFIKEFNDKNPLNKLNNISDINKMKDSTKDVVVQLLDYQMKSYDLINESISTKNKNKQKLIEYNEKYRVVQKKLKLLEEKNDLYDLEEEMNKKQDYKQLNNLVDLKGNELDIFRIIYGDYVPEFKNDGEKGEKFSNEKIPQKELTEEKIKKYLVNILSQAINKYGPIDNIFTKTNSTETERLNMRKLSKKYNLNLDNKTNEEDVSKNILNNKSPKKKIIKKEKKQEYEAVKWEYVSTNKPDFIDIKLENYLKLFYEKRTLPKIVFQKLSSNNYEYGTQKVMVKIEGDTIRIRYIGGYLLIDKFIELNSVIEEKNINDNNNDKNIKKKSSNKKK